MYNEMIKLHGLAPLPKIKPPSKVVRVVKSDIPEIGRGFYSLEDVGMKMFKRFKGCNGCKKCEKGCPEKALTLRKDSEGKTEIVIASDRCLGTACKACEMNCPFKVFHFTELKVEI